MATNLFPPILNNSQKAFEYTVVNYPISFSLPSMVNRKEIGHIQIKIVKQTNNRSIVNAKRYPDGIIYKDYIEGQNYVNILTQDLESGWGKGELYKVQMRFGANAKWYNSEIPSSTEIANFASWRQAQINQNAFSEWSTVMIIKSISVPSIIIANASSIKEGVIATQNLESTTTPLFMGKCEFVENEKEAVNKYRFILYTENMTNIIEDSGWLQHNVTSNDGIDSHRFSTILINGESYTVLYEIISNNGYTLTASAYNFKVQENYLTELENIILSIDDKDIYCQENGCIRIYLTAPVLSGNYLLTRTSEKTNYTIWEELSYFLYSAEEFNNTLIYTDFTIESGIKYKYAFQQENSVGLRTSPTYEYGNNPKSVNFEYSYLFAKNLQLRLMFNNQMSSFKHTVLANKSDSIGSKYPTISRNGHAYYAEFPITGLISLKMDADETFFIQKEDGYYYQDELVIPIDKYKDNSFNQDLTYNNIFIERIFREKVEEFLNNGECKLYKSPTEGNMIISLMNVSLSPKNELGRIIFSFSATAYEVLEFNLDNLNNYNLIEIGGFEEFTEDEKTSLLGQISGLYTGQYSIKMNNDGSREFITETPINLLELIKEQIEISTGGGYQWKFLELTSIWVEQYPALEFENELYELEAEKISLLGQEKIDEEIIAEYNKKIAELEALRNSALNQPTYPLITLIIGGKELSLGKNKVYYLKNVFDNLDKIYLKYSGPIIINFTCTAVQEEDVSLIVESIDTSLVWGQLAGIFTSSYDILKNYDYLYQDISTYRIPQLNKNNFHYENNFTVFKTENIFDIIKEHSKKEIELNYFIEDGFTNYSPDTDTWDNGIVFYNFLDIEMIEIEADEGTILKIINDQDKEVLVTIGPSEKYILNPSLAMIKGLSFIKPSYAIINYKCSTMQTTHKEEA